MKKWALRPPAGERRENGCFWPLRSEREGCMGETGWSGEWITLDAQGAMSVPSNPNIGFIEGDGTGPDIWAATKPVLDAAVLKAYWREKEDPLVRASCG